ncbi:MAG: hypothetical protein D6768_02415 [Chloroflexi bacterium]|nr:MAG: hypothetical protein D6768_02415 [Chloroflexota bacterium]
MPVSKKRVKKNQRKPTGPPISKKELANRKKPMSRQQIGIIIISALVVISMAIGFIVSGAGRGSSGASPSGSGTATILSTPAHGDDGAMPASDSGSDGATGSESSGQ